MNHLSSSTNLSTQSLLSNKKHRPTKNKEEYLPNKKYSKRDEDRILKYALKLSMEEQVSKQKPVLKYSDIPNASIFYANEEDLLNPIPYFESLWDKSKKSTGIIKIIPSETWKAQNKEVFENKYLPKFNNSQRKLDTRKMDLKKLYMAKRFEYVKDYNFQEYFIRSEKIFNDFYGSKTENLTLDQIEEDYWRTCLNEQGSKDMIVDYAADVPLSKYLNNKEIQVQCKEHQEKDWNLLSVNSQKNSLFQFVQNEEESQISGVTIPWIYFGMLFATFCWHTEDLYLYSLNYLHSGKPKIWYGISHDQKDKMDKYIKDKYFALLLKEPDLIHFLTVFISPLELMQNGIEVFKVIQNPGEIVVTLPGGYHTGFSTGFNIAEAVNFSTLNWLEYGFRAIDDYKKFKNKGPVFSLEWLIFHNIENIDRIKFDSDNYKKEFEFYLKKIVTEELSNRKIIELHLSDQNIDFKIDEIPNSTKFDEEECPYCKNFMFLSYIKCNCCSRKSCISHLIQCKCQTNDFTVFYRFKTLLEKLILI